MEEVMVDKLDQKIEVGQWVIKPWDKSFVVGKITEVGNGTFKYEYTERDYHGNAKTYSSLCKVPWRCLVVPEIVANYWQVLK